MSNTWCQAAKDGFQAVKLQRPDSGHRVQSLLKKDMAANTVLNQYRRQPRIAESVKTCSAKAPSAESTPGNPTIPNEITIEGARRCIQASTK
jgi:hypothetical protein